MIGLQSMMLELTILALMTLTVIGLAYYRHTVAKQQDFHLHVNETQGVTQQTNLAERLTAIDKWGKILTALTVVYFLVLAGWMLYREWTRGGASFG
ncbi:MAG: hypothetical protein HY820_41610 [Acidobacteria bacterium]|nr:hypothetical protein [Acidobacteriota bacterium]